MRPLGHFLIASAGAAFFATHLSNPAMASAQDQRFGEQARVLTADPFVQSDSHRVFTVQLGVFQSAAKAFALKGLLAELGPTLVDRADGERGEKIYRVLLGRFGSLREAEEFIESRNLRRTFSKQWVEPVAMDLNLAPDRGHPGLTEADYAAEEPHYLGFTFRCEGEEIRGEYLAKFPGAELARAGTAEKDLKVHWSCAGPPEKSWHDRELELHPSFLSVGALSGMGSLGTEDAATGNLNRSIFNYGARLTAFRNLDGTGFGPTLEYVLTNNRYTGDAGTSSQTFDLRHELNAGVRLPFLQRFEVSPGIGYAKRSYFVGTSSLDADFKSIYLPQLGLAAGLTLIQLKGAGSIGLVGSYFYVLSGSNADVAARSGSAWSLKLSARHFGGASRPGAQLGSEWYFQYDRASLGSTAHDQSASTFSIGLSVLVF